MRTLGIDLSSMPKGTSACCITWEPDRAVAAPPVSGCTDESLDTLIGEADAIGIDAPLGWPAAFAKAVAAWTLAKWDDKVRDQLRFRETDLYVRKPPFGLSPLSVSTDRIAPPAMRAMALLRRHAVTDRSGGGRFFEVYPAGSLKVWKLPSTGYKDAKEDLAARQKILRSLRGQLPWLEVPADYAATSDNLDSLVASLTVRAASQGQTHRPTDKLLPFAREEGWIHLPKALPTL